MLINSLLLHLLMKLLILLIVGRLLLSLLLTLGASRCLLSGHCIGSWTRLALWSSDISSSDRRARLTFRSCDISCSSRWTWLTLLSDHIACWARLTLGGLRYNITARTGLGAFLLNNLAICYWTWLRFWRCDHISRWAWQAFLLLLDSGHLTVSDRTVCLLCFLLISSLIL